MHIGRRTTELQTGFASSRKMAEKVEYSCSDPSKEVPKWLSQSKTVEGRGKTALDNLAL